MMKILRAFLMSFSMFCSIPCPIRFWDETLRPLMTAVLPLVGAVIGAVWAALAVLCAHAGLPRMLAAALMTLAPWVLSGYIHLDGFMDSCDAILSRRDLKERQRILKDPHTGSFAVISMCGAAVISLAAFYEADLAAGLMLLPVPCVTRALSAIAVQRLRPIGHSQYAAGARPAAATVLPAVFLLAAFAAAAAIGPGSAVCCAAALGGWCLACARGVRQLGGISGDISGYAITVGELCAAAAFALV